MYFVSHLKEGWWIIISGRGKKRNCLLGTQLPPLTVLDHNIYFGQKKVTDNIFVKSHPLFFAIKSGASSDRKVVFDVFPLGSPKNIW